LALFLFLDAPYHHTVVQRTKFHQILLDPDPISQLALSGRECCLDSRRTAACQAAGRRQCGRWNRGGGGNGGGFDNGARQAHSLRVMIGPDATEELLRCRET
ncbi:MAG TPA: hypothetical protein VGP52_09815, partial [Stellaceae bacterium]|nr:hypothetical protein [Stellaceae bacterium]